MRKNQRSSLWQELWDDWGIFLVMMILGLLLALSSAIEKKIDKWGDTPTTQATK